MTQILTVRLTKEELKSILLKEFVNWSDLSLVTDFSTDSSGNVFMVIERVDR